MPDPATLCAAGRRAVMLDAIRTTTGGWPKHPSRVLDGGGWTCVARLRPGCWPIACQLKASAHAAWRVVLLGALSQPIRIAGGRNLAHRGIPHSSVRSTSTVTSSASAGRSASMSFARRNMLKESPWTVPQVR